MRDLSPEKETEMSSSYGSRDRLPPAMREDEPCANLLADSDAAPLLVAESALPPGEGAEHAQSRAPKRSGGVPRQIMLLTFFGGIGGFLFGYDTGVISGALPYLRDELLVPNIHDEKRLQWVQGAIVSSAVAAAAVGSALGGLLSDLAGRKRALLAGDLLFAAGAAIMGFASSVGALILGRTLVGLGVGLASVTVPVYISEAAPPAVRASLITVNVLMITGGQFLAYLADYMFTFVPGTWRWMLGVAGIPAMVQAAGLLFLPESPKWLMAHGKHDAAMQAIYALHPADQAAAAAADLQQEAASRQRSKGGNDSGDGSTWQLLRSRAVRSELVLGLGLQILQQLGGINTVMYFTPAILQLAGVTDKRTALLVALVPSAVNAAGTLVGMAAIDLCGRRKLMLSSMVGVVLALAALGGAFYLLEGSSPLVNPHTSTCGGPNFPPDCTGCLRAGCGFCAVPNGGGGPDLGTCVSPESGPQCRADGRHAFYKVGCPGRALYTGAVVMGMLLYLAAFSPGMGPVPWAVNAEIYPLQLRGLASGAAATANWVANAAVSQTFLAATSALGGSGTFFMYSCIAAAGTVWVFFMLPETNGLDLDEIQALFRSRTGEEDSTPPQLAAEAGSRLHGGNDTLPPQTQH